MVRCMYMGVCVHERESRGQMNAHGYLCVCLHRWLHIGVGRPNSGVLRLGMQIGLCLPTWVGKQGLLLHSLGMAWGWEAWGSRHTECRDPSEAPEEPDTLKDWGKSNVPLDTAQSLALSRP